ncbi:MAG: NAD(P)H-hydrate epimerase, partial [Arachnia sp.]
MEVLTAAQMRAAEAPLLAAGEPLMARAASAVAAAARRLAPTGPVVAAVGPGNNGGDGLFAAAQLAADRDVRFWLVSGR